jgi:preprotein translocase subunit SecA
MRIFAAERISNIMQRLGMEEGVPIESKLVSHQIESAQKRVESQNFSYRKHVLEYDDVMNKQREAIYGLRRQLLEGEDQKEYIMRTADEIMASLVERHCPAETLPGEWDLEGLSTSVREQYGFDYRAEGIDPSSLGPKALEDELVAKSHELYDKKETIIGAPAMRYPRTHDHAADRRTRTGKITFWPWTTERRHRPARILASAIRSWNTRRNPY